MSPILLPAPPSYTVSGPTTAAAIGFERVLVGRSATLSVTFTTDGVATDPSPDSATVTIGRFSDETTLVNAQPATEAGTGVYTFTLTPAMTVGLDYLIVDWTATVGGQVQTVRQIVEVCGGFLFSLADARAIDGLSKKLNDGVTYRISSADIIRARTSVEQALERECGVAFVPRYARETVDGYGTSSIMLQQPRVRTIRSASVSGTALDSTSLATIVPRATGVLNGYTWSSGTANVTVDYEHGHDFPPARVSRAALMLAKRWLTGSPADDRATSVTTEEQTTTFYVPAAGEPFDVPEANAVVREYGYIVGVA